MSTYSINTHRNPKVGTAITEWTSGSTGTNTVARDAAFLGSTAAVGTITATATSQSILTYFYGLKPGEAYVLSLDVSATAAPRVRLRVQWRTAANANVGSAITIPSIPVSSTAWSRIETAPLVAPATADRALIYIDGMASNGTSYHVPAVGHKLAVTRAMGGPGIGPGTPYSDGDTPGWRWTGAAQISASVGVLGGEIQGTVPGGTLSVDGNVIDYVDAIAAFSHTSQSGSEVRTTLNSTGPRYHTTVRPSGPQTGTLTFHFVHETSAGDPGARALKVAESFRTGVVHGLWHNTDITGLGWMSFIPTGAVERRLEASTVGRGRRAVWTVEVEYTRLDGA